MGRRRKDGSSSEKGLGRGGVTPPDNTGKKYKRHVPKELDGRRNNSRPEVYHDVDVEELKKLCSIGCTQKEVEAVTGFQQKMIDKHLREYLGMTWGEFFRENAEGFKMSLRRMQYKSAMGDKDEEGNKYNIVPSVPMQIWLGKQFLGQKDKHEQVIEDKTNIPQFQWADAIDVTEQKQLEDGEEEEQDETDSAEGTSEDDQ